MSTNLTGTGSGSPLTAQLARFAELLRGSPHNLLSPRALAELETRHFPEAIAFAERLPPGPRLLDLGSGGGLPGVVIALARADLEVDLLEATGKKADFLTEACAALGLKATVHHGRAEELATGHLAGAFDLVTARAVAPLDRLAPLAAPYLRPGGQLHAIKGERWAEELRAAEPALARNSLRLRASPGQAEGGADGPLVVVLERTAKPIGGKTK